MNYKLHYEKLISKAQNRSILKSEYKEVHHIIPVCIGGSDDKDNLIALFPEEHIVAHLLLVKIYPLHHGITKAATMMTNCVNNKYMSRITNKTYSWLKKKASIEKSKDMTGSKNIKAKIINIYNNKNKLMYSCNGNFKDVCNDNNLPRHAFEQSYKENIKLFTTFGSRNAVNKEYLYFENWYAKIINTDTDLNYFKTKIKLNQNGKNNPQAKSIHIFNNKDELLYNCSGNFDKICRDNNLPLEGLRRTYINNTKLYETKRGISKAKLYGFEIYVGWYARIK